MKQITEDYCSYEVAKLLKEKGFKNEYCDNMLLAEDGGVIYKFATFRNKDDAFNATMRFKKQIPYVTLQMALKWLREVHKLHIKVGYDIQLKWYYDIISLKETVSFDYEEMKCYHNEFDFDSYEQAVEAALLYVLKNLI